MSMAMVSGARRAYVVRPVAGKVKRTVSTYDKKKGLTTKLVEKPAGYIVYFPRGHVLRLTEEQLRQHQLDKPARIINMDGIHSPNSPMGRLMMAQNDEQRRGAMKSLEDAVIQLAVRRTGKILMPEQIDDEPAAEVAA